MTNPLFLLWSNHPAVSLSIWALMGMFILYLGRKQAHQVFNTSGRAIYRTFRLCSVSLAALEKRITLRNRHVLLDSGEREIEKSIEREFERVHSIVERDLGQYPDLHRQVRDVIETVEIDYQNSVEAEPLPPAWHEVVQTITSLPMNGDPAVNKILQNIKDAVEDSHTKTLKAYKQVSAQRHTLLAGMRPNWRTMQGALSEIGKKVTSIDERAQTIDGQMKRYESMRAASDSAVASLSASAFTQFFISGLVLVIAVLGGLINFQLIAMPMSEMVGGASYIGSMKSSDIAALVIILIEIAMGLFLMESLKITHLFPLISSMDDGLRRRMFVITLCILTILAGIEASLAYMRDLLALDRESLNQALAGVGAAESATGAQFRWIPSIGQMVMGFILPFALAFVAIPLESFIHSTRIVLGSVITGLLRLLGVTVRLLGGLFKHLCTLLTHIYDIVIIIPLAIERLFVSVKSNVKSARESHRSTAAEKPSSARKLGKGTAKLGTDFSDAAA